jgi:cytochrome c556
MRRFLSILVFSILSFTVAADSSKIDLTDFDDEAMRNVEDAAKELESNLFNKEADIAVPNAEFIRDSLIWAEGYFAKKGAKDAVKWAQEGRELAVAIAASTKAKDFTAAYDQFGSLKKTCKSCHDAYKPPSL